MTPRQLSLPAFEGREPEGVTVSFTGKLDHDLPIAEAHPLEREVAFVVVGTIARVAHEEVGEDCSLVRAHTLKVHAGAVLPLEDALTTILSYNQARREAAGIHELPLSPE